GRSPFDGKTPAQGRVYFSGIPESFSIHNNIEQSAFIGPYEALEQALAKSLSSESGAAIFYSPVIWHQGIYMDTEDTRDPWSNVDYTEKTSTIRKQRRRTFHVSDACATTVTPADAQGQLPPPGIPVVFDPPNPG
ncbi:unnamed protein product, partial [marine sediment metagenome]